jgi:tetratricopeptide (TPR) repeat protein
MTPAPGRCRMWRLVRARQRHHRALRLWRAGRLPDAHRHIACAITLYDGAGHRAAVHERAGALLTLGDFQFQLARYAEAETTVDAAVRLLDGRPVTTYVDALIRLANSQRRQGKLDAAEATLRGAVTARVGNALLGAAYNALGVVYKDAGRYAEAATRYAAALSLATDPGLAASVYHNMAGLAHTEGRFADAVAPARRALTLHRRVHGPHATEVAADAAVLGAVLLGLGRLDAAEAQLRHAYRIWVRRFGSDHYEAAVCLHGLGVVQFRRGDPLAALRTLDEALRIKTTILGLDHPEIAALLHNRAVIAT